MLPLNFNRLVYSAVRQIPRGQVATYGQIAFLIGFPAQSRRVGFALRNAPEEENLPCHRVVNSQGRTVPGWFSQRRLLIEEGIPFRAGGCVDLKRCRWQFDTQD